MSGYCGQINVKAFLFGQILPNCASAFWCSFFANSYSPNCRASRLKFSSIGQRAEIEAKRRARLVGGEQDKSASSVIHKPRPAFNPSLKPVAAARAYGAFSMSSFVPAVAS